MIKKEEIKPLSPLLFNLQMDLYQFLGVNMVVP